MNKETSLNNLLYIHEHLSCRNYLEKVENGFKYIEFEQDAVILEKEIMWNHILFVLEGECIINHFVTQDGHNESRSYGRNPFAFIVVWHIIKPL